MIEDNFNDEFSRMLEEFIVNNELDTVEGENDETNEVKPEPKAAMTPKSVHGFRMQKCMVEGQVYNLPVCKRFDVKVDVFTMWLYGNDVNNIGKWAAYDKDYRYNSYIYIAYDNNTSADGNGFFLFLYKEGEENPIRVLNNASEVSCELRFDFTNSGVRLTGGRYFFVVPGMDMSIIDKSEKIGGLYGSHFTIVSPSKRRKPLNLLGAKSDGVDAFTLSLNKKVGDDSMVEAYVFDADTLMFFANGCGFNATGSRRLKISLTNRAYGWCDGRYVTLLCCNNKPLGYFDAAIEEGVWHVQKVGSMDPGCMWTSLLDLLINRNCDIFFEGNKSVAGIKDLYSFVAERHHFWRFERNSAIRLKKFHFPLRVALCGRCDNANSAIATHLLSWLTFKSFSKFDCSEILAQRDMNRQIEDDASLIDGDNSLLITNISSLADARLSDVVRRLIDNISTGKLDYVVLLGEENEMCQLTECCPELMRLFDDRVELPPFSSRAIVQNIWQVINMRGLKMSKEVMDYAFENASLLCRGSNWTLQSVEYYVQNVIIKSHLKRLIAEGYKLDGDETCSSISVSDLGFEDLKNQTDSYEDDVKELNSLVGLSDLKVSLSNLFDQMRFFKMRKDAGLKVGNGASYHTIFTGNPGTGKTTVAKLMGKIYRSLGILSKGETIVLDRSRIIGQYIGETEANMRNILEQARGNVLFIDEAYALRSDPSDKRDYGGKALEVLLPVLSQDNPDMVVILAGYQKEMEDMISSNPGLSSRFSVKLHFPDYNSRELSEIVVSLLSRQGYQADPEAIDALHAGVEAVVATKEKDFGNARWAHQLVEHGIIPAMAKRVMKLAAPKVEDLSRVKVEDVLAAFAAIAPKKAPRRQVGF